MDLFAIITVLETVMYSGVRLTIDGKIISFIFLCKDRNIFMKG